MNHKINMQHKGVLAVAFILLCLTLACSRKAVVKSPSLSGHLPLSKEIFLNEPFGYKPTIKNFSQHLLPRYKLQIYSMKNIHNPQVIDTIYRFYRKNTELFIYKTITGRELFFAANIYDQQIVLKNGVKTGTTREEFFKCFSNVIPTNEDSITFGTKRSTAVFNFIFKNNKLQAIKINNYID